MANYLSDWYMGLASSVVVCDSAINVISSTID